MVHISGRGAARYRYNVAYGVDKAAIDKLTADSAHELRPYGGLLYRFADVTRTERTGLRLEWTNMAGQTPTKPVEALQSLATRPGRGGVASTLRRLGRTGMLSADGGSRAASRGFTDEHGRTDPIPAETDGVSACAHP